MPKTEITNNHLGLPPGFAKFLISHAPLNSSGDIYHILAYLILARSLGRTLPSVLLTYDIDKTRKQAMRSYDFARTLGFSDVFKPPEQIKVTNKTYRERVRQANLLAHLREKYGDSVYVDQMATTSIVASAFQEDYVGTSARIRNGYAQRNDTFFPKEKQLLVDQMAALELTQVQTKLAANQPVVVLHIRHSSGANNHLNVPDNVVQGLILYLKARGYLVWCFLADDRKRGLPNYGANHQTVPFSSALFDEATKVDYSKNLHLALLLKLAELPRIKGVIGNTSGTLDLAAFVGNNVYNIHQFCQQMTYQDWRLSMQLTFISGAEDLSADSSAKMELATLRTPINAEDLARLRKMVSDILPNLHRWLDENKIVKPSIVYKTLVTTPTDDGYAKMFLAQTTDAEKLRYFLPGAEALYKLIDAALRDEAPAVSRLAKR